MIGRTQYEEDDDVCGFTSTLTDKIINILKKVIYKRNASEKI